MGKHRVRALGALIALVPCAAGAACDSSAIAFKTVAGEARFTVEIADDPVERAQGLMRREDMAADHGMLFVFENARQVAFWMKDTPLSLDILFLNRRGVICSIAAGTTPFSLAPIPSGCSAQTVLEIVAGEAEAQGLKIGAPARHPAIAEPAWPCE